jgi:hypothetical protein
MSRVRIHNFSISLDGFATGEGQAFETPFGHAGHRLHEWLLATRFAHREILREPGGWFGASGATSGQPRQHQRLDHDADRPVTNNGFAGATAQTPATG